MKKKIILLSILGITAIAHAQVGIFTDTPEATLDVVAGTTNTTNDVEGILVPRVTMNKAWLMSQNPTLPKESTLIYVSDLSDYTVPSTGVAMQVEQIVEKDFYHWDGTKWVRHSAAFNTEHFWARGITQEGEDYIYLRASQEFNDTIAYRNNRNWYKNLGGVTYDDVAWENGTKAFDSNEIPNLTLISSDHLVTNSSISNGTYYAFNSEISHIKESHAANSTVTPEYVGSTSRLVARDVSSDIELIRALNGSASTFSNGKVENLQGILGVTQAGNVAGDYTPTITRNMAGFLVARNRLNATSTNLNGLRAFTENYGTAQYIHGIETNNASQRRLGTSDYPDHTVDELFGLNSVNFASPNATVRKMRGVRIANRVRGNATVQNGSGVYNYALFDSDSETNFYVNYSSFMGGGPNASVGQLKGLLIDHNLDSYPSMQVGDFYGLHIKDIKKGLLNNYSIYTEAGEVSFGDNVVVRGTKTVTAHSFISATDTYPDYVFEAYYDGKSNLKPEYDFKSLHEVESFIEQNGHLPGYVSAKEVEEAGQFDMTATELTNVEKIEELYLHTIEQEAKINKQKAQIEAQAKELSEVKALVQKLVNKD